MKNRKRFLPLALAISGLTSASPAWSDLALNMTPGVTAMSREIYDLHMLTLWICVVIAVGVYGVMVYAIINFRKSKGAVPAKFTHSYTVEVIWTVIPALILVAMAVPAARTLIKMQDTRGSELTIKVTGLQWRWQYDYIDDGVRFYSTLKRDANAARKKGSGVEGLKADPKKEMKEPGAWPCPSLKLAELTTPRALIVGDAMVVPSKKTVIPAADFGPISLGLLGR